MQQCDETIHESEPAVTCKKDSTPILPSCCCESRLAEDQGLTSCCRRRSSTSAASGVAFAAGPTLWKTPARPTPASIADSDPCIAHSGSVVTDKPLESGARVLQLAFQRKIQCLCVSECGMLTRSPASVSGVCSGTRFSPLCSLLACGWGGPVEKPTFRRWRLISLCL